jgi:hypothetical protein
MLKKKISILSFIVLFLVSTTGLPIWSHYCEMMGKTSTSECEMCKVEIEKVESSCCSEELDEDFIKLTSEKSDCCVDNFDYKKVEDDFSQSLATNLLNCNIVFTTHNILSVDSQKEETHSQNNNYDLPPPKFGKELLNTIHQLKLDLPVC